MKYLRVTGLWIIFPLMFVIPALCSNNISNPGNPFIRNFTPRQFDAHPQNWTIIQDHRGVMYFGNTNRGLLEYDGSTWRRIDVANNSSIRSLALAADGKVYVGAVGTFGFLRANSRGERTYFSLVDHIKKEDRDFTYVWSTHVTSHGIYFSSRERIYRWHKDKMETFAIRPLQFTFAVYDRVFIPQEDGEVTMIENGIPHRLNLPKKKFCTTPFVKVLISPYDKAGQLILIATEKHGFYLYDLNNDGHNPGGGSLLKRFPTEIDAYIEKNSLYCTARLSHNCFAFGTRRGGIVFMDRDGKRVKIIDEKHGLQNDSVWSLYVDRENNLWAALNIGIAYIETSSPLTRFNRASGVYGAVVNVIKHRGDIYTGTFSGIFRLRKGRRSFQPVSNYNGSCWHFLQANGSLLAAGKGIVKIEQSNARRLTDESHSFCLGKSEHIPGFVFFGWKRGVGVMKTSAPGSFKYLGDIGGINGSVRKIVGDDRGNLWITTRYRGIFHLEFKSKDILKPAIIFYGRQKGLPRLRDNQVHYIDGAIHAATLQGIFKAEKATDGTFDNAFHFVPETTFGEWFSKNQVPVTQIYVDRNNTYWINSSLGFGALIEREDGLGGKEYLWRTEPFKKLYGEFENFFIEDNGVVWLTSTTGEGLIHYDPHIKKDFNRKYNALIRSVAVNDGRIIFYGDHGRLQPGPSPGQNPDIPALKHHENTVSFDYTAVFYEHPEAIRFKYKLHGFDRRWSDWTAKTSKEYTNLHHGEYTFQVKAVNTFRHESTEASYRFVISPPWYFTTTAYIIYTLLALFIIVLLIHFHLYRVRLLIARERRKYQLPPDVVEQQVKKLLHLMETEKPYLDPNLHIDQLAEKICIPGYQLSQLLNKKLSRNFFDFVNEYRINAAKSLLSGPEKKSKSILQIAYEVGFNSRSSFNSAFKKFTGASPSQFKKSTKST